VDKFVGGFRSRVREFFQVPPAAIVSQFPYHFSCWLSLPQRAATKGFILPLRAAGIWSAISGSVFDPPRSGLSSVRRPRIFLRYRVYRPTSAAPPSCWLFLLDLLGCELLLLVLAPGWDFAFTSRP
jgi:hypothetical protein